MQWAIALHNPLRCDEDMVLFGADMSTTEQLCRVRLGWQMMVSSKVWCIGVSTLSNRVNSVLTSVCHRSPLFASPG